jgi:hypothetical protein
MRKRISVVLIALILVMLACRSLSPPASTYENKDFSVGIPEGWAWSTGDNKSPYGLAFDLIVNIYHPAVLPQAYFSITTAPLTSATTLASLVEKTYEGYSMQAMSKQEYSHDGLSGQEITYTHNLGEGWLRYRDIWLEKGATAYVLSFSCAANSDEYTNTFDQILASFQFKD